MNVRPEIIIKKIEEKLDSLKYSIANNEKTIAEDLISIKAYCDVLLEAEKDDRSKKTDLPSKSSEPSTRTNQLSDQDEGDSLLDF